TVSAMRGLRAADGGDARAGRRDASGTLARARPRARGSDRRDLNPRVPQYAQEASMASYRDTSGRPVVVVTGMGVVTSLGAGKDDNWKKLTAGQSGIRAISRFSTEGLKTRIAGTVDFVPVDRLTSPALAGRLADMAAEEAVAQSGVGSKGRFPGPLFLAVAPFEVEWPQRLEVAKASGANDQVGYAALIRAAASGRFKHYHD